MAIVNGSLQLGYKDSAWFTANASTVLLVGQIVYLEQTGTYKLGDGVTTLSSLAFLGGGGGASTWGAITGTLSAQTDLQTALDNKEDEVNKSLDVDTDQASNVKYPSVKAVFDWVTSLFVKKGTITTDYILKGSGTDTATNSQIFDDGANGIQLNRFVKNIAHTPNYVDLFYNTGSALLSDVQTEMLAPICQMSSAGDNYARLESTGRKVLLRGDMLSFYQSSNAVGVVFDIEHGSGGGINDTIAYFYSSSGNTYLGIGKTVPTEALDVVGNVVISGLTASELTATDSNKKLVSLPVATYPSLTELTYVKGVTSALQTQLDSKLASTTEMLLGEYGFPSLAPADATIYYFGEYTPTSSSTTQSVSKFQFANNYTITKVIVTLRCATNASNQSVSFYLREAATTDHTITTSLDMSTIGANTNRVFVYSGLSIAATSGTNYELKLLTPTWVTNPTSVVCSVKIFGY